MRKCLRLFSAVVASGAIAVAAYAMQAEDFRGGQIEVAGEVELSRLVDLAANRLGVGVDYDAAILKGHSDVPARPRA